MQKRKDYLLSTVMKSLCADCGQEYVSSRQYKLPIGREISVFIIKIKQREVEIVEDSYPDNPKERLMLDLGKINGERYSRLITLEEFCEN